MIFSELKSFLDEKAELYNAPEFVENDPVQIPHRFSLKQDIEITGFLTATISWGTRKSIINDAEKMLTFMEHSPYDFVCNVSVKELESLKNRSMRLGVMRVLMLGAVLSALSNLLFAWLGQRGHDVTGLVLVVSADNLAGGIASAAFIAYLSSLTNVQYSATQYALFSSMMLLFPKWLAGFSGRFVDAHGYADFFTATAFLGLPVLVLVALASRVKSTSSP